MSSPTPTPSTNPSSPGKASLTNWWKQIKHDIPSLPTNSSVHSNELTSLNGATNENTSDSSATLLSPPSRPFLGLRSKSSNSVIPGKYSSSAASNHSAGSTSSSPHNPFSISLDNNSQEKLKQHRDSFLLQNKRDFFGDSDIFGVPLKDSINIAEGKICISSESGLVSYGRIPRVIAVCGIYLKKNGLDAEGIFRVAGSSRRIKQLQLIFSSPPDYGTKIDWDGYTVHDAASLFRRFLTSLPEPLIPFRLYQAFRDPLINRPIISKYLNDRKTKSLKKQSESQSQPTVTPLAQSPAPATVPTQTQEGEQAQSSAASPMAIPQISIANSEDKTVEDEGNRNEMEDETEIKEENADKTLNDIDATKRKKKTNKEKFKKDRKDALKEYAELFDKLPVLEKQLLFYILDLLATFNLHSAQNLMPARNLAAIFQPSILYHPDHDMSPEEYALSSLVIEFMIENSYKLLPAAANDKSPKAESPSKDNITAPVKNSSDASLSSPSENSTVAGISFLSIQPNTPNDNAKTASSSLVAEAIPPSMALKIPSSSSLSSSKGGYFQRRHSKSLSSVLNTPDMLRIQGKGKPKSSTQGKKARGDSITGDEINTDSAMDNDNDNDTEEETDNNNSRSIPILPSSSNKASINDSETLTLMQPPNPPYSPTRHHSSSNSSFASIPNNIINNKASNESPFNEKEEPAVMDLDEQLKRMNTPPALSHQQPESLTLTSNDPNSSQSQSQTHSPIKLLHPHTNHHSSTSTSTTPKKSGNWFSRLRSRSRSNSRNVKEGDESSVHSSSVPASPLDSHHPK